jgi:hypothetical protein
MRKYAIRVYQISTPLTRGALLFRLLHWELSVNEEMVMVGKNCLLNTIRGNCWGLKEET